MKPTECIMCHKGTLRHIRMRITMTYQGKSFDSPILDAMKCTACGEEYAREEGMAFILFHRKQAPNAKMSATFTELVTTDD